jgi:4-amino-4-deoxy-L-arabinose transferase-like glycosyltransferase
MLLSARTAAGAAARTDRPTGPLGLEAETWILVAITVVAAVLRFVNISSQSYWLDESQAVHEFRLGFGSMLSAWSSHEWNPPLYFVIGWPWAKLFGTGEAGLRALSALLGVALVPLICLCGRELVSRRAGLVAAAFAAVSPFMIWYSQEAREYMLLIFLCTASLLFFARAWNRGGGRDLLWWTVLSALALLTQYFAGFLIAAEGLMLVYRARSRASVIALGALGLIELALIPHLLPRLDQPAQFIAGVPLSERIQEVPVAFAMNTLYESGGGILSYGLLVAAGLAAIVIALLVIGADDRELRGAAIAATLAAVVLIAPLLLAVVGRDDYIARGVMPAWIPLAIVVAAACTTRGAPLAGGALAIALLALFIYAGVKIDSDRQYQKSDWRAVAAALGHAASTRAIVAYDGEFATGPLSIYLKGVPWSGPGMAPQPGTPVNVSELDIVADPEQQLQSPLPTGTRLISSKLIDGHRVIRLALGAPAQLSPSDLAGKATQLLGGVAAQPLVLIQRPSA